MLTTSNDSMNSMFDVDTRNICAILALIFSCDEEPWLHLSELPLATSKCQNRRETEGKEVFPVFVWSNVETDLNCVTWVAGVQRIRCPHMNQKKERLNRLKYITCSCCVHEAVESGSSFQRMESKQNSSQ